MATRHIPLLALACALACRKDKPKPPPEPPPPPRAPCDVWGGLRPADSSRADHLPGPHFPDTSVIILDMLDSSGKVCSSRPYDTLIFDGKDCTPNICRMTQAKR